ncbi:hypothetical protein [Saccharothrix deserti]|uniref:hypothetical protein n=1 Tax=Saccharothrix deserti TaxID=2593674 RepID=UPI00131A8FA8|nr:hypothetical protein [Saccharothrix deserti]
MNWRDVTGHELREQAQGLVAPYVDVLIRIGRGSTSPADQDHAAELAGQLANAYSDLAEYHRHMAEAHSMAALHMRR